MYAEIKQLVKHGSIYTMGIVLSLTVALVMVPVYMNCRPALTTKGKRLLITAWVS